MTRGRIRCLATEGETRALNRANNLEAEGHEVINICWRGHDIYQIWYREAVPIEPTPATPEESAKRGGLVGPTLPDHQCSCCQRTFDGWEVVMSDESEVARRTLRAVTVPVGKMVPYVLRGKPAASDSLERIITTICWKCWDAAIVAPTEIMFEGRRGT